MNAERMLQYMEKFRGFLDHLLQEPGAQAFIPLPVKDQLIQQIQQLLLAAVEDTHRQTGNLEAVITAMAEAVVIFDNTGLVIRSNPAAVHLFGIDPFGFDQAELVDILSIRRPNGLPFQIEDLPLERARQGETILNQSILMIGANEEECHIHLSASPLYDEPNLANVVTVWHDISEQERLVEQLEIEHSRLETIIEQMPQAIVVADEEGRLVLANPAAQRTLGKQLPINEDIESYERLNFTYVDGSRYDPRNLPLVCSALDGARTSNVEMRMELPDGIFRHLLVSSAPIIDSKGNLNGAVGVIQDITEQKHIEAALVRQAERSNLLATLSQTFAEAGLNFRDLLKTIASEVGKVFGDLCTIHLVTEDGKWHYPAAVFIKNPRLDSLKEKMLTGEKIPWEEGFIGKILQNGQPVRIEGVAIETVKGIVASEYRATLEHLKPGYLSGLAVLMRVHGRKVGVINVMRSDEQGPYSSEEQAFLQDLADRAALAVEDARLYEEEAQRARELQSLNRATTVLLSTIDLEILIGQILEAAQNAIPSAEQGALFLISEETGALEVRATIGPCSQKMLQSTLHQYASACVDQKKPLLIDQIVSAVDIHDTREPQVLCAIFSPMMLAQSVMGALGLFCSKHGGFTDNDMRLMNSFAATATAAIQNATLYAQVQRLATTDMLTQQYNRRKFFELGELEMHRFRRFRAPLSAIMFDLDHFKEINDTYGHAIGDMVLYQVAHRCRESTRVIDILGRYGGDEFAILLPDADVEEAMEIAERIREAVTRTPVQTSRGMIPITISLGVAQASPETATLSVLLGHADTALYIAKQKGRNRIEQGG